MTFAYELRAAAALLDRATVLVWRHHRADDITEHITPTLAGYLVTAASRFEVSGELDDYALQIARAINGSST